MRNLGSSVGISIVTALLSQNTQINHATLAGPDAVQPALPAPPALGPGASATGRPRALDAEITRQAAMIAYLDDFKLMMIVSCWPCRCSWRCA